MSLMGIDIGSSGCKAAVYSLEGTLLASSRRTYTPSIPMSGRMELDCNLVMDAILETIRESLSLASGDPVTALSVGSFSEAVVPVSPKGEVLGNSIIGSDNRHRSSMKPLEEMPDIDFYRINRNILSFSYTYPKLAWYRDEAEELNSGVWKYLNWSDFLVYYLTGNAGTTFSHANRTLLFDMVSEKWSDELLMRVGIDKSLLADPVPGGIPMGKIKTGLAGNLGFSEDVTVVSGGHDQCLNAVGAGAFRAGQSVTGIGTFECTTMVFDSMPDPDLMLSLNLSTEHHVIPGKFVTLIYNQAGSLLSWFLKVFARDLLEQGVDEKAILDLLSEEAESGPTGLVFIPTIEPTGAPYFLPGMSGTFHGIHSATTRGDLYKAVLEGESMYFLDTFERLEDNNLGLKEIIATGGGSRSKLWMQLKADLTGKPVKRTGFIDAGTAGAALLAGSATGFYSNIEEAAGAFAQEPLVHLPDAANRQCYAGQIQRFKKMFRGSI